MTKFEQFLAHLEGMSPGDALTYMQDHLSLDLSWVARASDLVWEHPWVADYNKGTSLLDALFFAIYESPDGGYVLFAGRMGNVGRYNFSIPENWSWEPALCSASPLPLFPGE